MTAVCAVCPAEYAKARVAPARLYRGEAPRGPHHFKPTIIICL